MNNLDLRINYNLTNDENKIINRLSQLEVFNLIKTKVKAYRNMKGLFATENGLPTCEVAFNIEKGNEHIVIYVDDFKYLETDYVECCIVKAFSWKIPF